MKMYILIKENVPNKFAPVITAHASLTCYKKFEKEEEMEIWINSVFKKVVCKVNEVEFENSKSEAKNLILTESALNNEEVCIVFCPRNEYSKQFKFFRMWTPSVE
jgi:peptidyl-tRNA hydrolase